MGGLFTPANWGIYVSTKHALESIAEAHAAGAGAVTGSRSRPSIRAPTTPATTRPWPTTPFRWLDDAKNFTKRADLRKAFDAFLAAPDGHLDPKEMIDRMIEIVPADTGKFRNVVPKATEDMLKAHQLAAWENQI